MKRRPRRRAALKPGQPASSSPHSLRLTLPRLNFLVQAQVEQIHEASLTILAQTGVRFKSPVALNHFRQAGARVEAERVYLDRALIEACLASTPPHYTLQARNPVHNVTIGRDYCAVMPGGGPPFVLDLAGRRRPGRLADLENFTRLSSLSPQVQVVARKAVEAQDVPVAWRHLECWRAVLTLSDKPAQSGFVGGEAEAEDALQMLALVFGGEAAIDGTPVAHCSVNANSPLLYDTPMLESMLLFARYGQPVLISPFVMAGVTGPTTLAGALAQHNAEVLAGLALCQLVRPGTPVLYGTASSNVDLRNANPAIGSPESALSIAICCQLARFYNLPCRGGGALTDSPIPDGQSNYERMFTLLMSFLSGVNFLMHGLGILESYLTMSYEQFVIDLELIAMIRHLSQPFEISAETLALETIQAVGPGGHFLEAAHTIRHYRQAHFLPQLSIRQPYEQWEQAGRQDTRQRAKARCQALLESYVQPPLAGQVADDLANFVERRKSVIQKSRRE
jgi:trimethylamine--corrinoid protein Co-methyltransferase